jgi:integrase
VWQQSGERPAVAVWTTEQTATFLGLVAQVRLAVLWWLIALRGLRRGEAAGLRWVDVDLDARVAVIEQQRIANGHLVTVGPPKTAASRRMVALDRHTVRLLREHRRRQRAEQQAAGEQWQNSGCVFVAEDGAPTQQMLNKARNGVRAVGERGNALLKMTFRALRNVSLNPWRIGKIVAAALVLLHTEHGRTT